MDFAVELVLIHHFQPRAERPEGGYSFYLGLCALSDFLYVYHTRDLPYVCIGPIISSFILLSLFGLPDVHPIHQHILLPFFTGEDPGSEYQPLVNLLWVPSRSFTTMCVISEGVLGWLGNTTLLENIICLVYGRGTGTTWSSWDATSDCWKGLLLGVTKKGIFRVLL